jgi:hypothetical protein
MYVTWGTGECEKESKQVKTARSFDGTTLDDPAHVRDHHKPAAGLQQSNGQHQCLDVFESKCG